jgi:RNA recognition motif-containing protein
MPAAKLQARKYSIYVKNIPDDLNNIGDLNGYFSKFGHINNINVDLNKKTALIKFKEIESA